ncbi:SH3 domain-containing protein 19 isoform X1 [Cimex lectularius]|uniref:SH3 domain-containing protein n=1 Tax=Cimex lectularius TaxID=79782 RepID=A0A8I6S1G8_CIMLE|nr:SH3 domain-containing protein 19 isoform X1 [Cimex lectularius]
MASHGTGLKVPTRPAPGLPNNRKSGRNLETEECVDPFSPVKQKTSAKSDKKVPPPRPPPPKLQQQIQTSRSIFGTSKKKQQKVAATAVVKPMPPPPVTIPTGTLIDLQSPPSSPLFENKLKNSLSFSKNTITKTSQPESGFEDDFNSLISSSATSPSNDPWSNSSDLSPSPTNFQNQLKPKSKPINMSKPTIICVLTDKGKPMRPPPPKACFGSREDLKIYTEKEGSPPMPSCPPPPPPPEVLGVLLNGPKVPPRPSGTSAIKDEEPYCVALYDFASTHPDDLPFKAGDKIVLTEQVSEEWLKGKLDGKEGIFPKSYVDVIVPVDNYTKGKMKVIAVFPFKAETWDDLELNEGDKVDVIKWINDDWLYGESEGKRGQFPFCFVQDITDFED